MPGSTLHISPPKLFDLPRAVCSYGYFLLAPNQWDADARALHTTLRGESDRTIGVRISIGRRDGRTVLRIQCDNRMTRSEAAMLRRQVGRMLRLDEDFSPWFGLHPAARRVRFARLFRSPTLFEDIVKTMTGCNVTWPNTVRMNALLCEHVGEGGFPTPGQLAAVTPARLKRTCKVGYRAERIIRLARDVERGRLDLDWFEQPQHETDALLEALRRIHGIGPYAAANLCQLLGRYDRLAIDTETYRHFRQVHDAPTPKDGAGLRRLHDRIERHYAHFAPYQFLAYWFELWRHYETRFGQSHTWTGNGPDVTARNLK